MSIQQLLTTQADQLEEEIRQDVIEIRRELPRLGYRLKKVYKEARDGLIFCAVYERTGAVRPTEEAALGYLRVSMSQQSDNHSLVTQARQMLALAQERGQGISHFYIEAGITGADSRRPAFRAMMRHALLGGGDRPGHAAVYCYDLYRFYRGLVGLTSNYEALTEQGVALISVAAKNTDLGSRDGKLLMYLKGIMGEMYLDDLSRTITDNKFTRAHKGYSNASIPPFGYCRGVCFQCTDNQGEGYCPRFGAKDDLWRELGDDPDVFVPHPVDQHAVRVAAELYRTGDVSDADIAQRLNPPFPDEMEGIDLNARTIVEPLEDGRAIVCLDDGTFAIQQPDGELQFFCPQGRVGRADPERRFTKDSIRDMLQNPYYAGFVVYRKQQKEKGVRRRKHKRVGSPLSRLNQRRGGGIEGDRAVLFPGQHISLISVELYDRCQQVRGLRGHNPANTRSTRRTYPLSGVLRCAHCEGPFRGNAGNGDVRYYEDTNRAGGASNCPTRSFRAEEIEEVVFAHVQQLSIPEEWDEELLVYLREGKEWDDWRRQRRALQSQLGAARAMRLQGDLSDGEFRELKRECARKLERLERAASVEDAGCADLLRDFPGLWDAATDKERKGLLHCIFSTIWLEDGDVVGYEPREPFLGLLPEGRSAPGVDRAIHQVEHLADRLAEPAAA